MGCNNTRSADQQAAIDTSVPSPPRRARARAVASFRESSATLTSGPRGNIQHQTLRFGSPRVPSEMEKTKKTKTKKQLRVSSPHTRAHRDRQTKKSPSSSTTTTSVLLPPLRSPRMEMEQTLYPELADAVFGSLSLGGDETEPHVRLSGVPHDDAAEFGCSANVGMRTPFFFFLLLSPSLLPPFLRSLQTTPKQEVHFLFFLKRERERAQGRSYVVARVWPWPPHCRGIV